MPRRRVTLRAVTALFLERQHLAQPRATTLTAPRLRRFVEDVGGIQLDSINVLDRAHYLTVWSRFGPYDRGWLDRQVYRRRLLFEYWAHAACLVPASDLPWWRRAMLDYRSRHTGWSATRCPLSSITFRLATWHWAIMSSALSRCLRISMWT